MPHKTFYFVPPSAWITKFLSDETFNMLITKPMAPTGLPDNVMMDIADGKSFQRLTHHLMMMVLLVLVFY